MDEPQQPDESAPDEPGAEEKSDYPGLIYGLIFGMMLGTVLFVLTDEVLWLAIGMPLGMAVGVGFDSSRR
ncbi:hypothetical protein [Ornithinimicrobium sufpigmenti]|uniref:hypothetical protein n=1 Tax=Ornithinimicrobium sufpigmenti TaxID=2508882 RepID=UPI001035513A|nr:MULTISPECIES: hypothetical protein [unclassified Ornithinimicrobium]